MHLVHVKSAAMLALAAAQGASAGDTLIAGTSFEEPSINPGVVVNGNLFGYADTLPANTAHQLINNTDQWIVDYDSIGGELGFSSHYFNTLNGTGLTEGDFVGVHDNSLLVSGSGATHGSNFLTMGDTDGTLRLDIDPLNLSGSSDVAVSFDLFVNATVWEGSDAVRIWVTLDDGAGGSTDLTILDTTGLDIDDNFTALEGVWTGFAAALPDAATATLHFSQTSEANSEFMSIDNIQFTTIPAPGALALMAMAFLRGGRRRRRMA